MEPPETETYPTFLDPALEILQDTCRQIRQQISEDFFDEGRQENFFSDVDGICTTMTLEFRFFKMFFWGLDHWQVSQEYDCHLSSATSTMARKFRQTAEEFQRHLQCECRESFDSTKQGFRGWQKIIKPFKQQVKEICILLLHGEIRCKPCQQDLELFFKYGRETASFIEYLRDNLQALLNSKHRWIDAAEQQRIDFIREKLQVFRKFPNGVSHSINRVKNLGELMSQTQTWANHLSCLAFLCWIDGLDESLASTVGTMLTDFMQETLSITPGVVASYFQDATFPQILASYIDFLLEELVTPPMKDDIETLREGLIFLLSFIFHPPEEDSEDKELILRQIYSIINELLSLICSIHSNEMEDRISETKLSDFVHKIAGVETKVRKLYAITPRLAQFNSPRTNITGFLDFLLQKLKKWLEGEVNWTTRGKHGIQTVWEELSSLRPFMQHLTELQNEEERNDLWTQIVNLVYYASYVTSLCAAKRFSMWYGIICLPSVIEEIKGIKNEVREINDPQMCKRKMRSFEMEFSNTMLLQTTTSKFEGAFIGFKEDTESIIDHLVAGGQHLTIISISGMPGQGKTTLAKRIFNDRRIQSHFHKTAWCYVSKECEIRGLMIHIVHDVDKSDEDISKLEIQDLAEKLRKSLKGRRYLVVMDDIWDVGVWCQVQLSFPNDKNGSRILFTSRNRNLISQDQWNFISYPLRSFSDEESWDLMKEKVSHHGGLGPEFLEIGRQIAICCKGLPLAVALVASLLGKTEQNLELWNQVAEKLKSHLASEGCMHIIELSYKYLPEHLKSCFLYFGAFPRGENISAKRLKLLWIAEGFVKENEKQCSKDLADECLDYLVSQSLVVVAEKNSMGGIKKCNVHDLLYDLCLEKIAEDNFLDLMDSDTGSSPEKYGQHRLCINKADPSVELPTSPEKYGQCRLCIDGSDLFLQLPTSPVQSLLWFSSDLNGRILNARSFLKSFKVLTVLNLEDVDLEGDVFPEVILCNIHLKYLALCGNFKNIPPSIAELWNLETLILVTRVYSNRVIPNSMWRMKSLRHVIIDEGYVRLEDFEGNESNVAALDNNIETLGGLWLDIDHQRTAEFFGRMTSLRKLKCTFETDALFSVFGSLENLEGLHFNGYIDLIFETCSFPQNKNLRKLSLEDLDLPSWSAMSTIGKQFPNLEVLKLESLGCEGNSNWDLEDGEFSNLRYLKLRRLDDLEEINVSDDCDNLFPCLEILVVNDCLKLKEIPSKIGEIGSLNTIRMNYCSPEASESVNQILEQQRNLGNCSLQVFVTNIQNRRSSITPSVSK